MRTKIDGGLGTLTITDYISKNPIKLTFDPDLNKLAKWYPLNNNYTFHYHKSNKITFLRPDYCHQIRPDYGMSEKSSWHTNSDGILKSNWVCPVVEKDNLKICDDLEKNELSSFTSYFGEYQLNQDMHKLLSDITALTTRITRRVGKKFVSDLSIDDYFEYALKQATKEETDEYLRLGKVYNMYVLMKKVVNSGS